MMARWAIALVLLAAFGLAYGLLGTPQGAVTATNGRAVPIGGSDEMFLVTLDLQNDGAPVTVLGVTSPTGADASFNSLAPDRPIVIPGASTAQFAADGAHIMLRVVPGSFPAGSFQPLHLALSDGTEVTARLLHPDGLDDRARMHHGMAHGANVSPPPSISLAQDPDIRPDGVEIEISVENFQFVQRADDAPHTDGQGHAHLYLNGLKLGRLYGERVTIGALSPGDYVLTISLHTNDHRPYVTPDGPVALRHPFRR